MGPFGNLRIAWLEAFVAVVDSGKQTAAAAELGVRQDTISRHVKSLEEWLGRVLVTSTVPVRLSEDGDAFLLKAREILRLLREAQSLGQVSAPPPAPAISARDIKVPQAER